MLPTTRCHCCENTRSASLSGETLEFLLVYKVDGIVKTFDRVDKQTRFPNLCLQHLRIPSANIKDCPVGFLSNHTHTFILLKVGDKVLQTSFPAIECLSRACKRSFLTNSLTRMMSGAYGDFPLKAKRAFTRAFAASSKFAVRSIIAAVMEFALEMSWF